MTGFAAWWEFWGRELEPDLTPRELAEEAFKGGLNEQALEGEWGEGYAQGYCEGGQHTMDQLKGIVANETEACARVCESEEFAVWETSERCAAAIRARINHD